MVQDFPISTQYAAIFEDLKSRVHTARMRATLAANSELVDLYLAIGRKILEQQRLEGWGSGVIGKLADDLRAAFPDMKGFSPRNLSYMRQAAEILGEHPVLQQVAAKLPWGHILVLINKLKTEHERLWYGQQAIEHGWSRAILSMQIESRLYEHQATFARDSNFKARFPVPQSDLATNFWKIQIFLIFFPGKKKNRNRNWSGILQISCSNLVPVFPM